MGAAANSGRRRRLAATLGIAGEADTSGRWWLMAASIAGAVAIIDVSGSGGQWPQERRPSVSASQCRWALLGAAVVGVGGTHVLRWYR
uniref:Uncharacterized protein n=1 Tax=Leersia perrieri TaxID=77586 RepID=A0A0D9X767_9ORYZ